MKNLILITGVVVTIIITLLFSNSIDQQVGIAKPAIQLKKWKLINGAKNEKWQEEYLFNEDNTFSKTRKSAEGTITVDGIYFLDNSKEGDFIELTFFSDNEIIGNCDNSIKERLQFMSDNKMINITYTCKNPQPVYQSISKSSASVVSANF